jgi:Glutathione S-transferase, C-terminal domain
MAREIKAPGFLKRWRTEKRQKLNFVDRDGVTEETRPHVEGAYLRLLDMLKPILRDRPFLFGGRPTLADIGLMGPMFPHFAIDPAPGIIMREAAPDVMAWVYRVWSARASRTTGPLVTGIPDDLRPLLREAGTAHLEALNAEATAWKAGQKHHDATVQGTTYRNLQTSQYRVWCLETLQARYAALDLAARQALDPLLQAEGVLESLLRQNGIDAGYEQAKQAPFGCSLPVFEDIRN